MLRVANRANPVTLVTKVQRVPAKREVHQDQPEVEPKVLMSEPHEDRLKETSVMQVSPLVTVADMGTAAAKPYKF